MKVEITQEGVVLAGGRPVDYATAYAWCLDNPEKITDLVEDTQAFVEVIAAAETASLHEQSAAVREAFAAGRPRSPGASWNAGEQPGPAGQDPAQESPADAEPAPGPAGPEPEPGAAEPGAARSPRPRTWHRFRTWLRRRL